MKKQILSFVSILFSTLLIAQNNTANDPVVMTVNGKDVKKSEFEYTYKKNNTDDSIDKKSLAEYVELFKNFKLKVAEAESLGMDTLSDFRDELNEYKAELIKSYEDNLLNEELVQQTYKRLQEGVEFTHILITYNGEDFDQQNFGSMNVYPEDTLAAYKKVTQIRKRLLQRGEDFGKVALEVSKDKHSLEGDIPGYLGLFTALRLMPDLEDGVYATPVGEISMPIRTQFGYHLVKVLKRQPNSGEIRTAHILVACPNDADIVRVSDAEQKVNEIYAKIQKGDDFGALAKEYSDDKGSGAKDGELPWFGYGRMVKEFETAAFGLQEIGAVSLPVRTRFGYHIVKLLEERNIAPYNEKRGEIISVLSGNGRHAELVAPRLEKMKQENGFSMNNDALSELQQAANTLYPVSNAFLSKFENNTNTLFLTGSTPYTIAQFIQFVKNNDVPTLVVSTDLLDDRLKDFQLDCLAEESRRQMESKNLEYRNLLQEYRDGILLYNIMNQEVWEKANQDIEGLKAFFEQNKNNYAWDEPHYKGYVVLCKDSKVKKKMRKEISKMTPEQAADYLIHNYNIGEVSHVQLVRGLFVKGNNPFIDELVFKTGKAQCPEEYSDFFVMGDLLNVPNNYLDVKGSVVMDYQTYLEEEWIRSLNRKYPVVVNKDIVNTIK